MKAVLFGLTLVIALSCGKKDPVQPTATNSEATNPELTKAKATAGVKLWEFETGAAVSSSPTIGSGGTVYVGSGDDKLYALSGKTGDKLWEFETG